ncbi:zinc finger protein 862-like [Mytilus edulis]|uniref:zinc finger protein 862-like n=1 Tax=Mytilus edulis TaxID=6550 RepID=UPI0039F047C1
MNKIFQEVSPSPSHVIKDSTETVCSTSTPASINISSLLEMFPGKRVHQYDLCKIKMCTNISKDEIQHQAKKAYKFQHDWLSKQKKAYCEKTSIWWGMYVEEEGIFCFLCKKHDTINPQNKSKTFNKEPSTRFRPETFNDHLKTTQHQNAITTEMYQRVSCFQKQLDKQDNVADEILYKAFEAVYWVMKEEIANLKIKSLLNLLERLGIEDMKYFQHRSQAALREIFIAIGGTLEDKLVKEVQQADHYGLMVDDVADISVMEQMVTFIQFYSKTECKVKTAFLSIDNLLEESDSANSATITDRIIKNIEEYGLKKDKLCSFVSDGASVMVGSRSGVAAKLKEMNPLVISIHCICHRLALACTDTLQNVSYIKNVHLWLMQLWSMFQHSPKKMAAFLKVQLTLKELNLTTEESKKGASKRLKKACTTRWLSFDSSVKAVNSEYEAILQTLYALREKDAAALGLYKKVKQVKFIATIYILDEILPLLSIVSKTFQKGTIDFSKIGPTLEYTKEQLNKVMESESPIVKLKHDLEEGKRLHVLEIKVTDPMITEVTNLLKNYISTLIENIDKRFGASLPVLTALSIFDPLRVPEKEHVGFSSYGQNQMKVLCTHFTSHINGEDEEPKKQEMAQMVTEFAKFKYDMITMKKEIPEECKPENAPCAVSSLEWSLQKIVQAAHFYPKLSCIADAILATPVSNAWPERGASCVKRVKTRLRSRISNDMLQALMYVSINGERPGEASTTIKNSVDNWIKQKKRRRLPRVSNTTRTGSLLTARNDITVQDFCCQTDDVTVQTQESLSREEMHQIVREELLAYSKAYDLPNSHEELSDCDTDSESDNDFF